MDLPVVPTAARTGPVAKSQGQLEWISNFVLVFVAVLGCLGGGTLLALYRIHLLTFISMEFIIVPFILLGESPSLAHLNRDKIESNLSVPGIQGHQENTLIKSFEMSPHLMCL